MTCPVTQQRCERPVECFHANGCVERKPRPIVDHHPALNTRAERRARLFWRWMWTASAVLLALTLIDFASSVLDHFERMEQHERAAQLGRAGR